MAANLSQFRPSSIRPPKNFYNSFNVAGVTGQVIGTPANFSTFGVRSSLSGAMTANTLKTVISVTGSGMVNNLAFSSVDATARTLRVKITVDGQVAWDATTASMSTADRGIIVCGGYPVTPFQSGDYFVFSTSLVVELASSLTETDKFNVYAKYQTF